MANFTIFYFKHLPCRECGTLSFAWFPGVWILYADDSEHHVCSIFLGNVNKTTYEDGTVCSETSAYKTQRPGNHPK